MILIVSLARPEEHDRASSFGELKRKFEAMTRAPALVQHYTEISPERVAGLPVRAIFITGSSCPWPEVDPRGFDGLYDLATTTTIPTHGACAGHQLLGFFFNATDWRAIHSLPDEFMRALAPGEVDVRMGKSYEGWFAEDGAYTVQILQPDPIFAGFEGSLVVREAHVCEVKRLPTGWLHLARTDTCAIQAMRHPGRPIYGTQFHPEAWSEHYPDGQRFMANFFRIAGLIE